MPKKDFFAIDLLIKDIEMVPIVDVCIWRLGEDIFESYWESGCNAAIRFWTPDGSGPLQWDWNFCPSCRSQIVQRVDYGS